MRRRRKYSVTKKTLSKDGKISLILGVVSVAAFVFCICASALSRGEGASYIGAIGIGASLVALYGCVLGIKEFASQDTAHGKPFVGTILSGVIFIVWLAIFLSGIKA